MQPVTQAMTMMINVKNAQNASRQWVLDAMGQKILGINIKVLIHTGIYTRWSSGQIVHVGGKRNYLKVIHSLMQMSFFNPAVVIQVGQINL
jgi:hypothetical protein